MQLQNRAFMQEEMNRLGSARIPFLFFIDFHARQGRVVKLEEAAQSTDIACSVCGQEWGRVVAATQPDYKLTPTPIALQQYCERFEEVQHEIHQGNSYLLNLTYPTFVGHDLPLQAIYAAATSPYKLLYGDEFLCYSPETFIRMEGDTIRTFPMKGTISATLPDAACRLLDDEKELFEHYTIVDLMRNDLAMVSTHVEVNRFRYIEPIHTSRGTILQTSSEISGTLPPDWHTHLGDILMKLLPAGSISGAPKQKTLEIIERVEVAPRGFYTGVMGVFDGKRVDSGVMIRFLHKTPDGRCYYHSGGGITVMSDCESEYNELITKIYVPTIWNHTH